MSPTAKVTYISLSADDPALDAASVVTGHHREDGVAAYLEDWLASH